MSRRRRIARAILEVLEQRRLMAGVVINEFLANNNNGIVDQDNDHSDWIELKNTDATSVNLAGWSLTDDAANLTKWQFPSTTIPAGAYLLVYASGKNRAVSGQQLHTNFLLDGDNGEYLALVKPGGTLVADAYNPFPPQEPDISYGKGSSSSVTDTLIGEDATMKAKVPSAASAIDATWRNPSFVPDGTWQSGLSGVGYDTSTGDVDYTNFIGSGLNVQSSMSGTGRTSVYTRIEFNVADPSVLSSLKLRMQYDDGFIAYLNGTEIGGGNQRRNFATGATPQWNSIATGSRDDSVCIVYEDLDITSSLNLLVAGNNVLAIQGLNVANSSDLLLNPLLTAQRSVGSTDSFMVTPSPGAANSAGTLGFVNDTHFSFDRGFYDAPIDVAITTTTPGATIRYTLDGTVPSSTNGTIYTTPLHITTTKTLRAIAYKTGWTSTDVDTQTYIFLNDVIHQTGTGLPSTANWGHNGPDWEMDQNVVNNPTYAGTIVNDLKAVPSMSLVMPWTDWFGTGGQGIYISGTNIEKSGSVEMISSSDPSLEFHSDASLEIQGASSAQRWNNDKLSIKVTFKAPFGPTKLNANMFTNPTLDNGATTKFDNFVLDSMYDFSWMDSSSGNRAIAKEIQDQYVADLQNMAGGQGPHGKFVHLYLNGLYWGMYYLHEIPDDSFAEEYIGGDRADYDVVKHNASTVVSGGSQATTDYNAMLSLVNQNMATLANYNAVAAKLDIDDFIDYMLVNHYTGNNDWASHNWYASYNRVDPAGKWRFHSWDAEFALRSATVDNTTLNDSGAPTAIHLKLMASPEYKLRFNDHVQKMMQNGGLLTPTGAAAVYQIRVNEIDRAIVGESARWGDNHREPPYLRTDWRTTQDNMFSSYFPVRTGNVLTQYTSRGWLLSLAAPTFSNYGGTVSPGTQLTLTKPGGSPAGAVIYYTTDGSDPRVAGTGAISGTATLYSGPITLNVAKRVKARVYNSGTWSAVVDATYLMPTLFPVRISELHYHPANRAGVADPEQMEFIELVNTSNASVNLQGVSITQFSSTPFVFGSINLAAGQRIVVAANNTIFQQVYGYTVNLAPTSYSGSLSNGGERIALLGPLGETLQDFTYGDNTAPGWPTTPDGGGPSLEINDPLADPAVGANWHASFVNGGTPGTTALPPTLLTSAFASASADTITLTFDHDMDTSSFAVTDIDVQLQPGGPIIHPTAVSFSDAKTANFTFATPLADGNYHATLLSGSVTDLAGAATTSASGFDFFALNADANHDRHVDAADQAILTAHLNQAGTFATGDFNRDGTVNSADQTILNASNHLWLPPAGALSLPATTGDDTYRLRRESASIVEVYAGSDVTATYRIILAPVTALSFIGGNGNDAFTFDASNGSPVGGIGVNFDGGNLGVDVLKVIGSTAAETVIFNSADVTLGSTFTYAGVETRNFTGGGGGDNLTVNAGVVALTAVESLSSLTIASGATLDIRNFGFIINYTAGSPLASIEGNIQSARGSGSWVGSGLTTSMTSAQAPATLATIGVAEANDVVNFGANSTALWRTLTVDHTTLLVRYTYAGDTNLDGVITGDDYFRIDAGYSAHATGYQDGDLDHNGKVDADDYFLIDSNYNKGQATLPGGLMAGPSVFFQPEQDIFASPERRPDDDLLV